MVGRKRWMTMLSPSLDIKLVNECTTSEKADRRIQNYITCEQ
jgi:hypothetical protein